MNKPLPAVYLVRHGETEWSAAGRHTGRTDIPLTPRGEREAHLLGERIRRMPFARVWTSPSKRAFRSCELAGFAAMAKVDADLAEWDYGEYEGLRSSEIRATRPDWDLFRDGCPGGESPAQISRRADRVIERIRPLDGDSIIFSSGHFVRVLAARWLDTEVSITSRHLAVDTASISAIGYEHDRTRPVITLWNESCRQPTSGCSENA